MRPQACCLRVLLCVVPCLLSSLQGAVPQKMLPGAAEHKNRPGAPPAMAAYDPIMGPLPPQIPLGLPPHIERYLEPPGHQPAMPGLNMVIGQYPGHAGPPAINTNNAQLCCQHRVPVLG
jgi:hypothetical protein